MIGTIPTLITAIAAITVPFITFFLGRVNENYKTRLEYRTFLLIDEIKGQYHLKNALVKAGSKLLLPKSYESLENFISWKKLDRDPNFTDVNKFNYLQIKSLGKSIIIGGFIKITLDNDEETLIETVLPLLEPNGEVYVPLDVNYGNVSGKPYGVKKIWIEYQLQTGQKMKFVSKRNFKKEQTVVKDSYWIKRFHLKYFRIHNLKSKNASWYYLNLNKEKIN